MSKITHKRRLRFSNKVFCLVVALHGCFYSCTSNPFGDDKVAGGAQQVSGTVKLADGQSAEGIYIWLDQLNVGSLADNSGNFQLRLPAATANISGIFKLYAYAANYKLATAEAVVRDGQFVYDKADINKNGAIGRPLTMSKFLRISTQVSPSTIPANFAGRIYVIVRLEAAGGDTVTVKFPGLFTEGVAKAFLKKVGSEEVKLLYSNEFGVAGSDFQIVGVAGHSRVIAVNLAGTTLVPGDYDVIPYLLVKHETVPQKLIESFGPNVEAFSAAYLKIPFRWEAARLTIE